ncbi:MAG: hypothetical protein EXR07_17695 [Acetobacteraceae bacterium]|nr:hypothetical protein [Acetobacteraceae bacterium]
MMGRWLLRHCHGPAWPGDLSRRRAATGGPERSLPLRRRGPGHDDGRAGHDDGGSGHDDGGSGHDDQALGHDDRR